MRQSLIDLFQYVRKYPRPIFIGILALLTTGFFTTLTPRIIGTAIDDFNQGVMSTTLIWLYVLAILTVTTLAALSMIVVRRSILVMSWEIQFDLRHDLFTHFTRLSNNYFENNRVGDLMARLTADLNSVRMLIGVGISQGINTLLVLSFTLLQMFLLNVGLTLLTLVIVPVIAVTFFYLLRIVHKRYERVQEQLSNVAAMAQENFSGIRVVKGFAIEDRELSSFGRLNDEFIKRNLHLTKADGPMFPLMEFMFGVAISLLVLFGGRAVIGVGSNLSIGDFVAFVLLFQGIQWPIIALGWLGNVVQRGATSWGRIKEILSAPVDIQDDESTDFNLRSIKGDIEFRNVTLKFDDFVALDNVSFHLRAGENLGITGRTGSGKTMLISLIARLLEPTSGEILIDGIDIKRFPLEVLRRHIGIVPQEPFLFSDSINENIAFGIPRDGSEARRQLIKDTAALVQLTSDVDDFGQGFDTKLGERGVTLSGGQRQRTAMARAIIRNPEILILDDSLSAVDTQTEANILVGLKRVAKGRTAIIVAHRVSAFQSVDRIMVLEQGRIVEQGSHDELIALDGWYADIDRRQQLEESLEAA